MFRTAALAAALAAAVTAAHAAPNLVTNGGFEQTTLTQSQQFTGFYSLANNHDYLWGPGNGVGSGNYSNNGLTASSPTGGNYILSDGDSNFRGAISQSISGLQVGSTYQLTFDWGAAQFAGYTGNTTEAWNVSFGNSSQTTNTLQNPSHGFSGWQTATMSFVADATTDLLSFLAVGTPNGYPPTLLLDNVNLQQQQTAVAEPASMALLGTGLAAIGFVSRRRRAAAAC